MSKIILSPFILSNIIQKISEDEPTHYVLIKLALVCKRWATHLVPSHFIHFKSGNFETVIRLATKPLLNIPSAREFRFTDIQLLRPTNKSHYQQLSNGKLFQFLQKCPSIRSLSLYNYSLENESNFGGIMSEILRSDSISLQRLELMNIDLVSNGSSMIIMSLKNNHILSELNLSRNFLKEKDGIILGDTLRYNKTITKLDVSFNEFRISGLKSIIEALQHNKTLTDLNLEAVCRLDCMITGLNLSSPPLTPTSNLHSNSFNNGIGILNSPISNNILLTVNGMNSNSFSGPGSFNGLTISPSNIPMLPNITELANPNWIPSSPSSISMNTKLIESIAMLKNNTTLKYLNLSHNTFGKHFNNSLPELVSGNQSITKLHLNYLKLDDECGAKIGRALKQNNTLKTLSLIYNQLGKDSGFEIACNMSTNTSITQLYLSNNMLNEDIGLELCNMLKMNTTLTCLDLSDNNIGANGAKYIMDGLRTNTTLTRLSFKNNKIGDNAGCYIANMIKENKSLVYLDVGMNNLQTNAGILISLSMESNSTLKYLNLSNNQMLEASNNSDSNVKRCHQAILNIFQRNKTLISLELEGNWLSEHISKEINNSLARNLSLLTMRKKKKKLFTFQLK